MQTVINHLPGYQVNEYQLILAPHEELKNRIMSQKEEFADVYKAASSRWSRPQITLAHFSQYELMEERILGRLKTIALGQYPFKVELKDYGSFPAHTIYINVVTKIPVQDLVKQVRQDVQRLMKIDEERKPHFILEPFVTIASKLKAWQYEKGWLDYSRRHFTGRFVADRMYLMKRSGSDMKYKTIAAFDFENLPVAVKQGELFF